MTRTTHHGPQQTVRLAFVAVLMLGLTGCAAAGKSGAQASGASPSSSSDEGIGSVGEIPEEVGGDGGVSPSPEPPLVAAAPAPEDCVSYNPANLTVAALGDAWILKDGGHSLELFDTKSDADNALKVARNWKQNCFIGRDNDKPDRYRYIINYFKTPSGLPLGLAPTLDCVTYNPAQLALYSGVAHPADPTQDEWALYSGPIPLLFLASEPDALRAKIVAEEHTKRCLIGHGNDRPDPARYLMYHWQ